MLDNVVGGLMPVFSNTYYWNQCSYCRRIDGKFNTKEEAQRSLNRHEQNCPSNSLSRKCKTCEIKHHTPIGQYLSKDENNYHGVFNRLRYCKFAQASNSSWKYDGVYDTTFNIIEDDCSCYMWNNENEQQNQTDGIKNLIQDIRRTYFKDINKSE